MKGTTYAATTVAKNKKPKKKSFTTKTSRGNINVTSSKDPEYKQGKKHIKEDQRLSDASGKILESYANRNSSPRTSMWTGKTTQGTSVQTARKKLAKSELERRKKVKEGNSGKRISGKESVGGNMR